MGRRQYGDDSPWTKHAEGRERFLEMLARDPEDVEPAWVPRILACHEAYREALAGYPELAVWLRIVLPDLQRPLDNAVMLRGSALLYELLEDPDYMDEALAKMAQARTHFPDGLPRT